MRITPVSISLCMVCNLVFYIIAFYLVPAWAVVLHEAVPFLSLRELLPVHLRVKMQQICMQKVKLIRAQISTILEFLNIETL